MNVECGMWNSEKEIIPYYSKRCAKELRAASPTTVISLVSKEEFAARSAAPRGVTHGYDLPSIQRDLCDSCGPRAALQRKVVSAVITLLFKEVSRVYKVCRS